MKQLFLLVMVSLMVMGGLSCTAQSGQNQKSSVAVDSKIEVYYFHFTRRCMTCNTVESETKNALQMLYPNQLKSGDLTFTSINLDDDGSKAVAQKCKAGGQGLLVMEGDKRIDLTSQGFMYAVNNPDKLKQEIQKAIDPLMASK
jgi:hypothetical protein